LGEGLRMEDLQALHHQQQLEEQEQEENTMTELDLLEQIGFYDRANINNIKTYNNNKNFTDSTLLSGNQQDIGFAPLEGTSSQEVASLDAQGLENLSPPPWKYIKLDLFDNANPAELLRGRRKLRLNLSMLVDDNSDYHRLMASLNTEFRFLKRGLDFTDLEQRQHYDAVSQAYKEINDASIEQIRVSKCYLKNSKGKGKIIPGMSVIVKPNIQDGNYTVILFHKTNYYIYELTGKNLTSRQRQGNMIASAQWGLQQSNQLSVDDFFSQPPK